MKRYVIVIGQGDEDPQYYWHMSGTVVGRLSQATWFTAKADAVMEVENIPRKFDAVIYELVKSKPTRS